jgi:hypothetical protein
MRWFFLLTLTLSSALAGCQHAPAPARSPAQSVAVAGTNAPAATEATTGDAAPNPQAQIAPQSTAAKPVESKPRSLDSAVYLSRAGSPGSFMVSVPSLENALGLAYLGARGERQRRWRAPPASTPMRRARDSG